MFHAQMASKPKYDGFKNEYLYSIILASSEHQCTAYCRQDQNACEAINCYMVAPVQLDTSKLMTLYMHKYKHIDVSEYELIFSGNVKYKSLE